MAVLHDEERTACDTTLEVLCTSRDDRYPFSWRHDVLTVRGAPPGLCRALTGPDKVTRMSTEGIDYADRLRTKSTVWWKRVLNVQAPYRARIRSYNLGRTLEIGCGIGRLLVALPFGSVGIDHNPHSIADCRRLGLEAYTTEDFLASHRARDNEFDSMMLAHVLEHMTLDEGRDLLAEYLRFIRPGGKVLLICPQQKGYTTDHTHVQYLSGETMMVVARRAGLQTTKASSFPLPAKAGQWFTHNEHHVLATKPR